MNRRIQNRLLAAGHAPTPAAPRLAATTTGGVNFPRRFPSGDCLIFKRSMIGEGTPFRRGPGRWTTRSNFAYGIRNIDATIRLVVPFRSVIGIP